MDQKTLALIRPVILRAILVAALTIPVSPRITMAATYMGWRAWLPTVTFYGERKCPECDSARRALEMVGSANWRTIRIVFVNVRWHKRAAAHDGVTSTPTLIYRTHKRTEVARQQGVITEQEVESSVAALIDLDRREKRRK
ncbi:MAG: hypothetical protein ACOYXN_08960 [Acidobacteriota bacterium]